MRLYIIRDKVAKYSGQIIEARRDEHAIRTFVTILNSKGTQLNESPSDFELCHVGYRDEETGKVDGTDDGPRVILDGATYLAAQQQKEMAVIP